MEIRYKITFLSDAEPGTGAGGAIVNQRVPRDRQGRPCFPASHIKGLLREELSMLETCLGESAPFRNLAVDCLGAPGQNGEMVDDTRCDRNGIESRCRFTDVTLAENQSVVTEYVTRTAIAPDRGRGSDKSLRTTENIPAGTVFEGAVFLNAREGGREDLALRLALLALGTLGGNRNRGSGVCVVDIIDESRTPGDLLESLDNPGNLEETAPPSASESETSPDETPGTDDVLCRLVFRAEGPVCCPEIPVRTGAIRSGFAIPASAVQGMILNRLASFCSEKFVTECYRSDNFRAWPLLPCALADTADTDEKLSVPVRVSLTHKVAKQAVDGDALISPEDVEDQAIEVFDWTQTANNNPLKAQDGVLLVKPDDGSVLLWRARAMPHRITAHGVHNDPNSPDERNLYQLDALEPMIFSGFVRLPKTAFKRLEESLKADPRVAFGRSRSVRGQGVLSISRIEKDKPGYAPWRYMQNYTFKKKDGDKEITHKTDDVTLMILQSPVLLNDKDDRDASSTDGETVNGELKKLVRRYWGKEVEAVGATAGIVFGWNRHGEQVAKDMLTGKGSRIKACRVLLPGSIFRFENAVSAGDVEKFVLKGLGEGREQGFGAVAVHPGLASQLFKSKPDPPKRSPSKECDAIKAVLDIWNKNQGKLPSASQIYAVQRRLENSGKDVARDYLARQIERTERIWATWEPIQRDVDALIHNHAPEHAAAALKMLADLAISDK